MSAPALDETSATVSWRLKQLERTVDELERKVDRLVWALTLCALSFAGASAMLVVTAFTAKH